MSLNARCGSKYKKIFYVYEKRQRFCGEEINFEAESALILKVFEISYINLVFVKTEFCFLYGYLNKASINDLYITIERKNFCRGVF